MENWMNKMQEYDKRIGVPEFEGWQQREIEAYKKHRLRNKINSFLHFIIRRFKVCFWKYRKQQTKIFEWNRERGYW